MQHSYACFYKRINYVVLLGGIYSQLVDKNAESKSKNIDNLAAGC